MDRQKRELIYYSALFHDIGKAVLRKRTKSVEELASRYEKNLINKRCKHPRYSAVFLEQHREVLEKILPHHVSNNYDQLIHHVLNHHSCQTLDELIILASDWLSSFEREFYEDILSDTAEKMTKEDQYGDKIHYKSPLVNIFNNLMGHANKAKNHDIKRIKLKPLDIQPNSENFIEDLHIKKGIELTPQDYRDIDDQMDKDIDNLYTESQIFQLLKKYYWSVPSQTNTKINQYVADISLFDHLKTTAAIALCLYDQIESNQEIKDNIIKGFNTKYKSGHYFYKYILYNPKIKFYLIHGDLSGIQDYLYNIPSKNAAKSLKGRSVYMNLLMQVIAQYILDKLELKEANLLYVGGGSFIILAPKCSLEKFKNIKKTISDNLFKAHHNQLYVSISETVFELTKFAYFNEVFEEAHENTKKIKQKRWEELGDTFFNQLFKVEDDKIGKIDYCSVCNRPIVDTKQEKDASQLCSFCKSLIKLTSNIKDCRYEVWEKDENKHINTSIHCYEELFSRFGYKIKFCDALEAKQVQDNQLKIYGINHCSFKDGVTHFKFGGYQLPTKSSDTSSENQIISFDELASLAQGANYLAMLKLDIDNLGLIFKEGFAAPKIKLVNSYKNKKQNRTLIDKYVKNFVNEEGNLIQVDENILFEYQYRTISRVTSLSRMISMFFEGYIPELINSKYESVYLVYSGGDDTVAIGSWNEILELHQELRDRFDEVTCGNYSLDFSSAIGIYPPNFNLRTMALQMEKSLKEAKKQYKLRSYEGMIYNGVDLKIDILIKGNTYLMGEVFNRIELDKLLEFKHIIFKMLEQSPLQEHKAMLRKILKSTKGLRACIKENSINPSKYWRLAYYLKDLKDKEHAESIIDKYTELLLEFVKEPKDDYDNKKLYKPFKNLMIVPTAIKWNELWFRGDKQ